jgi:isoleucyl-tRNA synthetase
VLHTVSLLMAPIAPFVAEEVFANLSQGRDDMAESVHLMTYPEPEMADYRYRDERLEERMELVRDVVNVGRSLRNEGNVKVRQPLPRLLVVPHRPEQKESILSMVELIKEELNVKEVVFADRAEDLMVKRAEPIFRKLGPKFGKQVNQIAGVIRNLDAEQVTTLERAGELAVNFEGREVKISSEDVKISAQGAEGLLASIDGELPVALDTQLTDELIAEGYAREIVNRIQNMRKDAGFDVVDRIEIAFDGSERLTRAIKTQENYIKQETLAEKISKGRNGFDAAKDWTIDGEELHLEIKKV